MQRRLCDVCVCVRMKPKQTSSYKLTGHSHTSMAFTLDVQRTRKQHCTERSVHDFVIMYTKSNVFILVLSSKTLNHVSERASRQKE